MYLSGDNCCFSCINHNPEKIIEIYINIEKQGIYKKIIENNKLEKITRYVSKKDLFKLDIDNRRTSNDIIIRREKYQPYLLDEIINIESSNSLIIIADQLTDQNNLGNIIRTSLLMGADGIVTSEHSSALITSATSNTSSGAIELLKFHVSKNISRSIETLKKKGYWVYALDIKGEEINTEFYFDKKSVLIIGNEGKGIRKNIIENSDFKISLPQKKIKGIDSYNAANSLALAAYHYKINNR